MAFEQKPNSGSIFSNERKEQPSHPDRTGSCNIDGKDYWVNGWLKETKDGKKYLSLSFKPKEARGASQGGGGGRQQQAPRSQQSYDEQRGGRGGGDARHSRDYERSGGGGGPIDDIPFAPDRH